MDHNSKKEENIKKWGSWQYNVRDHLKPLSVEQIKEELNKNKLSCAVLIQNIEGDFNIGNIIRTSNNFNISNIYYYGKRHIDKRSTCGTYHYSPVTYLNSFDDVLKLKSIYKFIALENNIEGSCLINSFVYPSNSLFIFGEENIGISKEVLELADYKVEIPSRGSVRSLNVGSAAAIVLYDFWLKSQ